jgi:membrane-associated phospholipid phosphatase
VNDKITSNFQKIKGTIFILPIILLGIIAFFLYKNNAINATAYIDIQKNWFYALNTKLSQWPYFQYNLTQMGDALIFLSLLTIFILKAPKVWQALATASIISAIFSKVLKSFFAVPRPAAVLSHDSFTIIGEPLMSTTTSLPSGHSITNFTILSVLLFAFLPKEKINQILFYFGFVIVGLMFAFTRVGVGAHFPLDVFIGSIIGYISGVLGIFIQNKFNLFSWIGNKKYHPFFIVMFLVCLVVIIKKSFSEPLFIFFFTSVVLIYSLYLIILDYVKK